MDSNQLSVSKEKFCVLSQIDQTLARKILVNFSRNFKWSKFLTSKMAVPKATTIKEAIKRFEDRFKCNAIESKEVQLQFQWPPIEKMDPQLGTLVKCE